MKQNLYNIPDISLVVPLDSNVNLSCLLSLNTHGMADGSLQGSTGNSFDGNRKNIYVESDDTDSSEIHGTYLIT